MGLYYKTIFLTDINKLDDFIILSYFDQIIDDDDKKRGFVYKDDVIQFIKKYRQLDFDESLITDNTFILEYTTSTLDIEPIIYISCQIPVK